MLYVKYANPVDTSAFDIKNDPFIAALFNDAPDAIFILDAKDYTIIDCNSKSLEIFETESKMSLISLSSFRLYESEPVEFSKHLIEKNIKNAGEHTQELAFRTLKQNIFWGRLKKRPFVLNQRAYILLRICKINDYLSAEETLSTLLRGTSQVTGTMFLKEFVKLLCRTFDVKYSFIAKLSADKKSFSIVQSYGFSFNETENNFPIEGTMVENVARGYTTFYPTKIGELFPDDKLAIENNIEGFMGTPVYGNSGEVMGIVAFLNDKILKEIPNSRYILSIFASRTAAELQRIRSKEILKEQTRDLALANSIKDKLLAVISDDLLDPMGNLLGFSNNLRTEADKYNKMEYVERMEIIDNSLRNIFFILSNLSEWSKLHREPVRPHLTKFNLKELVNETFDFFRFTSELKDLKTDIQIEDSELIGTDKNMYGIVIRNIVSNAIKFNKNDGNIIISSFTDNNSRVLKIEDTGYGMSPIEVKFLQKNNLSADPGSKTKNSCGLGYILSRELIELLGGKIELESEPDKGTKVTISLPDISNK